MEQLRNDPTVLGLANRQLQNSMQNVPALNPLAGMGAALGVPASNVSTVDQLYATTMRNKQLKAFEFAQSGQFSYKTKFVRTM